MTFHLNSLACIILVPEPVVEETGCVTDAECPSKEACLAKECKNPCLALQPCVQNAECQVYDTLPRRTLTCACKAGYSGKGDSFCEKLSMLQPMLQLFLLFHIYLMFLVVAPIESGCLADAECPTFQACEKHQCVSPCQKKNPCAKLATCVVNDHKTHCECPVGMAGDPYITCVPSKPKQ